MKKSKVCLFAYRPEHYREMEAYLNQMMAAGWKLKWCRSIFAGFEPADRELRYGVDPEAMTSLAYFRRLPKRKLKARMAEGWHAVARSKGCQIYATVKPDAPELTDEMDQAPLIKSTCRLASLIWVLALAAIIMWLFAQAAFVYTFVLTNLYLVLGLLAAGLLLYHAVNAILLTVAKGQPAEPRVCKRYLVHSFLLLILLLLAIALEMGGRNDMLLYLAIPIVVIALCIVLLQTLSGSEKNSNRIAVAVVIISVLMFGMIIFLNTRMSQANSAWSTQQQEELLAMADELPVLRLKDGGGAEEPQRAAQTNRSILGSNLLYAEQEGEDYIFTNCTVMQADFLAKPIFDYLYDQAQADYGETFAEYTVGGITCYVLEEANGCLFRDGGTVCFFTAPESLSWQEACVLLQSRLAGA